MNELAGAQGPAKRSNAGSDEALTEALTSSEAPTPPLVPPPAENLFTKFIKIFMETMQAQARDQEPLEPRERIFKARTPNTYSGKSHMDFYYFCQ